ncbi:hypothetical protein A9O67_04055 [Tepidimonas fonticaldi]|uniref:Zinc finger/thioredoxin putative domain-containing protein n=1 Tax=Tepidimonas fonticaldi TaxID=1101373 RepID=A0A1A6DTP2_9BURK|nr:zinc-ribbon and DUF3426 domain-containing protein [Tepidimonas fonticaldi]OBS30233.1 hypothetical protein A9O67_04055 [Tepidimonas fonticaldi]
MSFITRCPSCGTAFKVVADQLKIADGWVRCGHCQQVFDATLDLQPAFAPLPPSAPPPSPGGAPPSPEATPQPTAPPPMPAAEPPGNAAAEPGPAPEPEPEPEPAPWSEPEPEPESDRQEPRDDGYDAAPSVEAGGADVAGDQSGDHDPFVAQTAAPAQEPSFVRQARRRAFWRRPVVRVILALLALGLAALLAGQIAWVWRDTLAARYPAARPALAAFCDRLGCTIAPPRRPQDVLIEGSVLLRRAPDRYSFHLVVRNHADTEVAAPALELTLTDLQDQVLVRRVWTPDAWPQPLERLAPGAEWPLQLELAFDHPDAARMTGYRAVLFYP